MTPDEIVSKFSVALDNFKPITDQPSDSDLTRLREAIALLLLQIPYDETGRVHNLIGIVWVKPAYIKRYGEAFPRTHEGRGIRPQDQRQRYGRRQYRTL